MTTCASTSTPRTSRSLEIICHAIARVHLVGIRHQGLDPLQPGDQGLLPVLAAHVPLEMIEAVKLHMDLVGPLRLANSAGQTLVTCHLLHVGNKALEFLVNLHGVLLLPTME